MKQHQENIVGKRKVDELKHKRELLSDIWIKHFYSYPFYHGKVKFTDEEKTNYVGTIFGYFQDSLELIFDYKAPITNFNEKFSYQIALLQSIFVQQDFIFELFKVFKVGYNKDVLTADPDYQLNRDIRNELIGHPVRRYQDGSLRSSTVFSVEVESDDIRYLRYEFPDEKNNLQRHRIDDILFRHRTFLNRYFDVLIQHSAKLLKSFQINVIQPFNHLIEKGDIHELAGFIGKHFRSEFDSNFLIKVDELTRLADLKEHPRYSYSLGKYVAEIAESVDGIETGINEVVSGDALIPKVYSTEPVELPIINFVSTDDPAEPIERKPYKRTSYHYEMGKVLSENPDKYGFAQDILYKELQDEPDLLAELEFLISNRADGLLFRCSWMYLNDLLEKKLSNDKINQDLINSRKGL